MATTLDVVQGVQRVAWRSLIQVDDILMITLPWTFSPCLSLNPRYAEIMPSPWVITVAYSFLEPLATRVLLWLNATPRNVREGAACWHFTAGILLLDCALEIMGFACLDESKSDKERKAENGLSKRQDTQTIGPLVTLPVTSSQKRRIFLVFLLAPLTSAFQKAAMLLSDLGPSVPPEKIPLPGTWRYNESLLNSVLSFLALPAWTYFIEWIFYAALQGRAKWLGAKVNQRSSFGTQIGCLSLGLAIRISLRALLGIDPLLAFRPLDEHTRQNMQGTSILESLENWRATWKGLLLIPLEQLPLYSLIFAVFWLRRQNLRRSKTLQDSGGPVPNPDEEGVVTE